MKYEIKMMLYGIGVIGFLLALFIFGLNAIGGRELVMEYNGFMDFMLFIFAGGLSYYIVFKPFAYQKPKKKE